MTTIADKLKSPPPIVYGELSILGYNGYIPNISGSDKSGQSSSNGRRNKSKFLLCKRPEPNGIKKSRHYIVKQQPQATKAIQDKDLHSISYTFSRSQTIIVEYRQDEKTDMFQIGRSSEDPIDFIVTDTILVNPNPCNHRHHSSKRHENLTHNENSSSNGHSIAHNSQNHGSVSGDDSEYARANRYFRHLVKTNQGNELISSQQSNHHDLQQINPYFVHDNMVRCQAFRRGQQGQPFLVNYPFHDPHYGGIGPMLVPQAHRDNQELSPSIFNNHRNHHYGHSTSASNRNEYLYGQMQPNDRHQHPELSHCQDRQAIGGCGRSHASQSTISRFACRILVDREPPYIARIYAAGFDSSKNIFLGEKATKWEQDDSIDGLTTNGILLMHPKQELYCSEKVDEDHTDKQPDKTSGDRESSNTQDCSKSNEEEEDKEEKTSDSPESAVNNINLKSDSADDHNYTEHSTIKNLETSEQEHESDAGENMIIDQEDVANNNDPTSKGSKEQNESSQASGGVWREVSVDGGIYAIRESRSAAQKGIRIEHESNVLQDGTLIDLCGATLLWRSVKGFMVAPTKRSLEEKIDHLNATRPQCPVGLNTLIIPRKPILPSGQLRHHQSHRGPNHQIKDSVESSYKKDHYPYVYLKCGHVQGYHDWGATDKLNQRTCPICLMVGTVSRLSIGLEPSFYVDTGPLSHAFNPCGHMASEKTVRYWCSIKIPHGTHFFHSICPFCATPLSTDEPSSTRLIFQHDLE